MKLIPLLFLCLSCVALAADKRPNVLLLMSDDLAATLGCYGYPQAKTPNLDALTNRSVQFNR
ncbi:MAG: sulfatase-like hydrolase/transferase, partial [Prosthecobacter sp.]